MWCECRTLLLRKEGKGCGAWEPQQLYSTMFCCCTCFSIPLERLEAINYCMFPPPHRILGERWFSASWDLTFLRLLAFFARWSIQLRARFLRRARSGELVEWEGQGPESPRPGCQPLVSFPWAWASSFPIWQVNGLVPELLTLLVHLSGVLLFPKQWLWWAGQHQFLLQVWGGSRRACMRFGAGIDLHPISITVSGSSRGTEMSLWSGS